MHDLVRRHGAKAVNHAGVEALGYPAILATESYEVRAVERRLAETLITTDQQPSTPTEGA